MTDSEINVEFLNDAHAMGYTSSDLEGDIGSDRKDKSTAGATNNSVGDQIAIDDKPSNLPDFDTIDEPIKDTISRDIKAVGLKFYHVFLPRKSQVLIKEWDLWGPLILCIFFAMFLQDADTVESNDAGGPQFAQVFVITFLGAFLVTLNSKLLGGSLSFFQSVCVLGYCLVPLAISLLLCKIILLTSDPSTTLFILRSLLVAASCAWALYASFIFLGHTQPSNRKALAMYPIFLYYFVVAWMVLFQNR